MKKNILYFLTAFLVNCITFSQFINDIPLQQLPTNLNGELENSFSIFGSNRFNINHGFSMSMHSINNQNISIAGYTNNISYLFNENLLLSSKFMLYKENTPFNSNNLISTNQLNMGYEFGLKYRPSKNSFLELKVQSLPYSQIYNQSSLRNNGLFD
jgi:hypothetical protein